MDKPRKLKLKAYAYTYTRLVLDVCDYAPFESTTGTMIALAKDRMGGTVFSLTTSRCGMSYPNKRDTVGQ